MKAAATVRAVRDRARKAPVRVTRHPDGRVRTVTLPITLDLDALKERAVTEMFDALGLEEAWFP